MKKIISTALAAIMLAGSVPALAVSAEEEQVNSAPTAFTNQPGLYVHAVLNSEDGDAWQLWQSQHDEDFYEAKPNEKYFFLPSSADNYTVDVYNAYDSAVTVNGVTVNPKTAAAVNYEKDKTYTVSVNRTNYSLKFMKSEAEAAVYINNSNADGNGTDLMSYLNSDKSLSAKATGAIVTPDGKIDNTAVKKIKGRGNTSWDKAKKGYNITYDKKVSIAGMTGGKKYSILANYQDDSLSRNRFLYDLSDAVGMPYASDSRFVDFYVNGFYWGSYLMCEKVEVGSSALVNDFEETDYLNEDGTAVNEDFPFVCEVDASAGSDDYYFVSSSGNKITIKAPEIEPGEVGYDEVKNYVKTKFDAFYNATNARGDLSAVADIDSVTKLFLINELGKNWDSGVSSTFFTYKQDENGEYKFYGSPVWDYDNSIGNANGVANELRGYGCTDYTQYTGWWCQIKGKGQGKKASTNIMNRICQNRQVIAAAPEIWFEKFVPAFYNFTAEKKNAEIDKNFHSLSQYYSNIKESAEMNYASGWYLNTGSWIAEHSRLSKASFNTETLKMEVEANTTSYARNFDGMFNYCVDWFTSRAAWISEQYAQSYTPKTVMVGDANKDGTINIVDASVVQRLVSNIIEVYPGAITAADVNDDGKVTIDDATCIQKYIAKYTSGYGNPGKVLIYG